MIISPHIVAIIPARGDSKSIPRKNIIDFCGKPLIAWSIQHAMGSKYVNSVYVSTDDKSIADVSRQYGAEVIERPHELATDYSTSEDALLHALSEINKNQSVNAVVFLQATSPLREPYDIDNAIEKFFSEDADSLFSGSVLDDLCLWEETDGQLRSLTYDYRNRGRRQDRRPYYLENGSIYIFKPDIIRQYNNRFGRKNILYLMQYWKSHEIDNYEDLEVCEYYMKHNILKDQDNPL